MKKTTIIASVLTLAIGLSGVFSADAFAKHHKKGKKKHKTTTTATTTQNRHAVPHHKAGVAKHQ